MPIVSLADTLGAFIDWARGVIGGLQNVVTGSLDETVQAVVDIKELDCGGDWTVYIKTAVPAAGAAMILLLTPSPQEIFESYLEPKPGRRHGRRGRRGEREHHINKAGQRRLYFGGGIPDIDNQIADMLPGRGFFSGRRAGPLEWVFWTGVNVADRALWYWLLLEATETYFTVWHSGLIESGQCVRGGAGYAKVVSHVVSGGNFQPAWDINTDCPVHLSKKMFIGNSGQIEMDTPGTYAKGFLIAEAEYTVQNDNPTETISLQVGFAVQGLDVNNQNFLITEKGQTISVPPGESRTLALTGYFDYPPCRRWNMYNRFADLTFFGPYVKSCVNRLEIQAEAVGNV